MIDCHAHLADEAFREDLSEVLERARNRGISAGLCVAEGLDDCPPVLQLARDHDRVHACLGLHPTRADLAVALQVAQLIRNYRSELVGIGEVGLDYWVAKTDPEREVQQRVLTLFVDLSLELDLPLNVHSRSAGHHTLTLLADRGAQKVLMHAFDGRAKYALRGVELGYLFSIPPSVVRSPQKQKLVRRLPLSHLLLETDSPVLGPNKTERNEPANALIAAETIARIKERPLEEVVEITRANSRVLFDLQ